MTMSNPQGEDGWEQKEHVAETFVKLNLVDENDNDPVFSEAGKSLSLPEDTPRGTVLATFTALDPDNVSIHPLNEGLRRSGSCRLGLILLKETCYI